MTYPRTPMPTSPFKLPAQVAITDAHGRRALLFICGTVEDHDKVVACCRQATELTEAMSPSSTPLPGLPGGPRLQ